MSSSHSNNTKVNPNTYRCKYDATVITPDKRAILLKLLQQKLDYRGAQWRFGDNDEPVMVVHFTLGGQKTTLANHLRDDFPNIFIGDPTWVAPSNQEQDQLYNDFMKSIAK